MQIVPLVEHPELVDQVAAWGFAEWGHLNSGQTLQSRTAEIHERLNIDRVPVVLVALDDAGTLVGTASLLFDDLESDPRNPWLASVFVPLAQRGTSSRHRRRDCTPAWAGAPLSDARIAANISR